ncbi:hypothetical protein ACQY0O_005233 [Thecaphora frezii]
MATSTDRSRSVLAARGSGGWMANKNVAIRHPSFPSFHPDAQTLITFTSRSLLFFPFFFNRRLIRPFFFTFTFQRRLDRIDLDFLSLANLCYRQDRVALSLSFFVPSATRQRRLASPSDTLFSFILFSYFFGAFFLG